MYADDVLPAPTYHRGLEAWLLGWQREGEGGKGREGDSRSSILDLKTGRYAQVSLSLSGRLASAVFLKEEEEALDDI